MILHMAQACCVVSQPGQEQHRVCSHLWIPLATGSKAEGLLAVPDPCAHSVQYLCSRPASGRSPWTRWSVCWCPPRSPAAPWPPPRARRCPPPSAACGRSRCAPRCWRPTPAAPSPRPRSPRRRRTSGLCCLGPERTGVGNTTWWPSFTQNFTWCSIPSLLAGYLMEQGFSHYRWTTTGRGKSAVAPSSLVLTDRVSDLLVPALMHLSSHF